MRRGQIAGSCSKGLCKDARHAVALPGGLGCMPLAHSLPGQCCHPVCLLQGACSVVVHPQGLLPPWGWLLFQLPGWLACSGGRACRLLGSCASMAASARRRCTAALGVRQDSPSHTQQCTTAGAVRGCMRPTAALQYARASTAVDECSKATGDAGIMLLCQPALLAG